MQTSSLYAHTPQLVVCKDARTNRKIIIVGSVHFNPASIALAKVTVENTPDLGAVVVESCESRWRRSLQVSPPGSFLGDVLPSEMQAAAISASSRGVPISLGDVDVGEFTPRLKTLLKQTLVDLLSLEGWNRIWKDLKRGSNLAFDTREMNDSLQPTDFIKPDVLLGFTVSLIRYPIAAAVKAPVPFSIFATILSLGTSAIDNALGGTGEGGGEFISMTNPEFALTTALTIFNILLPLVFARILLVGFLEERNVRLARSITEAAERGDVVAILGGLHVNGVAKLLEGEGELKGDGGDDSKSGTWWTEDMIVEKDV